MTRKNVKNGFVGLTATTSHGTSTAAKSPLMTLLSRIFER
jgi:hypothetical protein